MSYQIQVKGAWAGSDGPWRPAVDGTFNQTGWSAERASTFATEAEASDVLRNVIGADYDHEFRSGEMLDDDLDGSPVFRIVEVQS